MLANLNKPGWPARWPRWLQHAVFLAAVFVMAWCAMQFVRVPAADWMTEYADFAHRTYGVYPPWIAIVMWPVRSLATQNALTLTALAYALWRNKAAPLHYALAFTALPLYWNLWLGQTDYIPLFGLYWLPWGLALVALKPQIAIWGAAAWWLERRDKWKIAAAAAATLALSLAAYGWWPARLRLPITYNQVYNLSAWHWGGVAAGVLAVVAGLLTVWTTRDADRAMAAGALASPYVQGNSYLLLLPALTRLTGWRLMAAWLSGWASVLAVLNLGDVARPLAALFPATLWILLTWETRRAPVSQRTLAGAA